MAVSRAPSLPPNIVRDAKTVAAMIRIDCRDRHGTIGRGLCASCQALATYADQRLAHCRFGAERAAMQAMMRHAGPKMIWRHPLLALRRQGVPTVIIIDNHMIIIV